MQHFVQPKLFFGRNSIRNVFDVVVYKFQSNPDDFYVKHVSVKIAKNFVFNYLYDLDSKTQWIFDK